MTRREAPPRDERRPARRPAARRPERRRARRGDARARVARQWEQRATAELRVAAVFSVLARELFEAGAEPVVLQLCARAVSDEVRHAEICRLLASRYAAREIAWPAPGPTPMPLHGPAPDALRPTLHVAAMCCINETIASAWLEASQRAATSPLACAAIRELMADDVFHARIGWAHVTSSRVAGSPETRAALAAWLPRLLEAAAMPWARDARGYGDGVPAHGVPSREVTLEALWSTVEGVVLPGFAAAGVETAPAREWMEGARARER